VPYTKLIEPPRVFEVPSYSSHIDVLIAIRYVDAQIPSQFIVCGFAGNVPPISGGAIIYAMVIKQTTEDGNDESVV